MDAVLMQISPIIGSVAGFLLGGCLVAIVYQMVARTRAKTIGEDLQRQIDGAKREAENIIKTAQIEAAAEAIKKKEEFTNEANRIRSELRENEVRLSKREDVLERQTGLLQEQEKNIKQQEQELDRRLRNVEAKDKQLTVLIAQQKNQLLKITGMQVEEARQLLLKRLEDECEHEMSALIQRKVDEAKEMADDKCREVISCAIQRYAAEQTCEVTVSTVEIPNDDMKGRIIGREGRNIRALEAATGIEIVVDDTPEAIVLSGFDPIRREVARLALHQLVQDGRIHPARIEEVVTKVKKQVEEEVIETGKRTAIDLGVHGLHPELIRLIGKMKYRSSYGQNLLQHARETANLCAVMASELGLNPKKAKRAGLLHDIGKVPDDEPELPHAILGMKLCEKYKEKPDICNAVGSHHDEVEMTSLLAPIVQVCDAISGARPGARREIVEAYIKRLNDLEQLAMSYPGVMKTYAIQAGRELRVIVGADKIDDAATENLSNEIAKKIQDEMTYPGQVKITVIRETRSVSYAK